MDMTTSAGIVLAVMVLAYSGAKLLKLSPELSMVVAALAGSIAGGFWIPPRQLAEGAITYLDINLIFITATLFMNVLKESGGVAFVVRRTFQRFHNRRAILLIVLTFLLLLPGALTGAGSVTVLITGGMVASVLGAMGIPKVRVAAIVFIVAGLSAAAPPVSLWAMMTAAGVNMPYVGFFLPLLIPCVGCGLLTVFFLGWKGAAADVPSVLATLPAPPEKMSWLRVLSPFGVFLALVVAGRIWPYAMPVLGLPLIFLCAGVTAFVQSPRSLDIVRISKETIDQLLPLIGTLTCVGILVQIMTLTGVRGLLAVTTVTLPIAVVYGSLFFLLPASEAVLMWGAAPVIGVPLVLLFNTIGLNPIVALAGMSIIWPLGDALPPTAIIGRLTVTVVEYSEPYSRFLRACLVPAILIIAVGTLMVIYSKELGFLTGL
jgi:hypothetical protein